MNRLLIILVFLGPINLFGQNLLGIAKTHYEKDGYRVYVDTLGYEFRNVLKKSYPEYIIVENTGNRHIKTNDYFINPHDFSPSILDPEGEIISLKIDPLIGSGALEAKFFLLWQSNMILSPTIENIQSLGKLFYDIIPAGYIEVIKSDKKWTKDNNLNFRCTIGADGKVEQLQILIPYKHIETIVEYLTISDLIKIDKGLKQYLNYPVKEDVKAYMQRMSLKYIPYKMEDLGYYLNKYLTVQ